MSSPDQVRPLVADASAGQVDAILGVMRAIAAAGGTLTKSDGWAIAAAALYMFGREVANANALPTVAPPALANALQGTPLAGDAVKFLTVMAFVDGALDKAKVARVLDYAKALGVQARYLDEITEAAGGQMQAALADMTRANMESIIGKPWAGDVNKWLLPYGANPDPALAARFEALGQLGPETFGRTYYVHFKKNNYPFPGEPKGLNAAFAIPHDSAHVLSGYDTTPRGEILVSTFTAAMHPKNPMAGHVLPVIFTWQLDNTLNQVAGGVKDALDPREFWHAWAAGTATKMDTFAPGWDFWGYARQALGDVRERLGVPRAGLDSRTTGGS